MSNEEMLRFRISETEKKITTLDERLQKTNEQISRMQVGIAETNAYVKQIYDEVNGTRNLNTNGVKNSRMWSKVVFELIRAMITIAGIIAGVKLMT